MTIPDRDLEYLISNYKNGFSFYDMAEVNKVYGCPSGKDISVILYYEKLSKFSEDVNQIQL